MAARWCLGLKAEAALPITLNIFSRIIEINSNSNYALNKSEPEKARIRLVCGAQVLKFAQEINFRSYIGANLFHLMAKLIIVNISKLFLNNIYSNITTSRILYQVFATFFSKN